jgi:hypothetical protein
MFVGIRFHRPAAMPYAGDRLDERRMERIRRFILEHDDRRLFTVLYIGLAVVLSIWISLFWLIAVVAVHFAFELFCHRHRGQSWSTCALGALWEIKLDVALVAFALVLGVYMDVMLGVVGLSGAGRVAASAGRVAGRFAVWERVLRGFLLSVDDAAQVGRAIVKARKGRRLASQPPIVEEVSSADDVWTPPWRGPWGLGDRLTLGFGVACVVLVIAAPVISHHDLPEVLAILADDLDPWPDS